MPKSLSYSLRFPGETRREQSIINFQADFFNWKTNRLFPDEAHEIYSRGEPEGGSPYYYLQGFLTIQNAIAKSFIEMNNGNKTTPEIVINRFPFPSYTLNVIASQFSLILPLLFLLCLNYTFMNTVRFISIEKENQLKEAMKIMGLAGWMHYLSWFIRTMIMLSITMFLITTFLTVIAMCTNCCAIAKILISKNTICLNNNRLRHLIRFFFIIPDANFRFKLDRSSKLQFSMLDHLFPWILYLFDNIWFCDLCNIHNIQKCNDSFNDCLVSNIGAIFFTGQ